MKAKYTIEPTAVVNDFNYNEAEIFTNKADLIAHLLSHDGYELHIKIENDIVYVCNAFNGCPPSNYSWCPTYIEMSNQYVNTLTVDMRREAIMQIWGDSDILDPYKLSGSMNITLETARSLTDAIQDGKACGETDSIEAQENLLAKLHGTDSAD
jgi:hypothetical protein